MKKLKQPVAKLFPSNNMKALVERLNTVAERKVGVTVHAKGGPYTIYYLDNGKNVWAPDVFVDRETALYYFRVNIADNANNLKYVKL